MTQTSAKNILCMLKDSANVPRLVKPENNPFKTLIVTIISQNTADTNTERAFENLSKTFEITPEVLAKADTIALAACLRVAGLYQRKAQTIKAVSRTVIEKFGGSLSPVLALPLYEARKMLMDLQGIGPKTADVVLLFSANQPILPVDTHVNRVSKRLGLAPSNGGYEEVRLSLQSYFEAKDYLVVHLLLIAHGRKYCRAQHPRCRICPVKALCPSKGLGDKHD